MSSRKPRELKREAAQRLITIRQVLGPFSPIGPRRIGRCMRDRSRYGAKLEARDTERGGSGFRKGLRRRSAECRVICTNNRGVIARRVHTLALVFRETLRDVPLDRSYLTLCQLYLECDSYRRSFRSFYSSVSRYIHER